MNVYSYTRIAVTLPTAILTFSSEQQLYRRLQHERPGNLPAVDSFSAEDQRLLLPFHCFWMPHYFPLFYATETISSTKEITGISPFPPHIGCINDGKGEGTCDDAQLLQTATRVRKKTPAYVF